MWRNDQIIHTYMTWFQNEYISIQKTHILVWCLHCLYRYNKTSNAFSPLCIFELKVVFRYHFLSHFLAELNEICCGSLLNSILKNVQKEISLNILIFFIQQNLKFFQICVVFFHFFICMSSMCVQLFTAFEEAVLKLYVPWWVPKNQRWPPFPWKRNAGKIILVCSPYFFILIIINVKWNEWIEKWAKQFFDQHLPLTCPKNGSYTLGQVILARKLQSSCTTRTKSALAILRTASTWTRPTRDWCHTQFRSILYEGWDNNIVLE